MVDSLRVVGVALVSALIHSSMAVNAVAGVRWHQCGRHPTAAHNVLHERSQDQIQIQPIKWLQPRLDHIIWLWRLAAPAYLTSLTEELDSVQNDCGAALWSRDWNVAAWCLP